MTTRLGTGLFWIAGLSAATAIGVAIGASSTVAFVLVAIVIGVAAITMPAGVWVLAALVASLTLKGLASVGAFSGVAVFLDIAIAWGALVVAWVGSRRRSGQATTHLLWLGALVAAVLLAWAFHTSEPVRPVVYLALLGEPFAIVGALLLDPPGPRLRRALVATLAALVAVQVPLAAWQLEKYGVGDKVQGTLWGASAGAHVMSAVVGLGAVWLLLARRRRLSWSVIAAAVILLAVPIVADAKQVLFVLPAAAVVAGLRGGRLTLLVNAVLVVGAVVALFYVNPVSKQAVYNLQQVEKGQNGKLETAKFVWRQLETDPTSIVFGKGPAETVSRAAFLTTDVFERRDSSLRVLGLEPAAIAVEAQAGATRISGGSTSFNSGVSSMLGVLGDLGLFGALAYGGLLLSVLLALLRTKSGDAIAASAGWVMFAILGLVFDWWEQPPFTVFLGALTGLALTAGSPQQDPREPA